MKELIFTPTTTLTVDIKCHSMLLTVTYVRLWFGIYNYITWAISRKYISSVMPTCATSDLNHLALQFGDYKSDIALQAWHNITCFIVMMHI